MSKFLQESKNIWLRLVGLISFNWRPIGQQARQAAAGSEEDQGLDQSDPNYDEENLLVTLEAAEEGDEEQGLLQAVSNSEEELPTPCEESTEGEEDQELDQAVDNGEEELPTPFENWDEVEQDTVEYTDNEYADQEVDVSSSDYHANPGNLVEDEEGGRVTGHPKRSISPRRTRQQESIWRGQQPRPPLQVQNGEAAANLPLERSLPQESGLFGGRDENPRIQQPFGEITGCRQFGNRELLPTQASYNPLSGADMALMTQ